MCVICTQTCMYGHTEEEKEVCAPRPPPPSCSLLPSAHTRCDSSLCSLIAIRRTQATFLTVCWRSFAATPPAQRSGLWGVKGHGEKGPMRWLIGHRVTWTTSFASWRRVCVSSNFFARVNGCVSVVIWLRRGRSVTAQPQRGWCLNESSRDAAP